MEDASALDLLKTLKPWVPEGERCTHLLSFRGTSSNIVSVAEAFVTLPDYEKAVQEDANAKDFVPPGNLVHSYVTGQRSYEIWAGSLADPRVQQLLNRAQIFVSLFIEAGTPLATDDPEWTLERWTVYFMYATATPLLLLRPIAYRAKLCLQIRESHPAYPDSLRILARRLCDDLSMVALPARSTAKNSC